MVLVTSKPGISTIIVLCAGRTRHCLSNVVISSAVVHVFMRHLNLQLLTRADP